MSYSGQGVEKCGGLLSAKERRKRENRGRERVKRANTVKE